MPRIIAHRGASAYAPENTMAAFSKAARLDADWVELDIHLSGDGRLVVIHDTTVDRTTNGSGPIWKYTTEQLKSLDAGSWFGEEYQGERLPLLKEVYQALPDTIGVNVEVKSPGKGDTRSFGSLAVALVEELDTCSPIHPTIVSSFEYPLLEMIHSINTDLPLAYLYATPLIPKTLPTIIRSGKIAAIHPYYRLVTSKLIDLSHACGIQVNPWTVDAPSDIAKLNDMGVDGVITNVPDVARSVVMGT